MVDRYDQSETAQMEACLDVVALAVVAILLVFADAFRMGGLFVPLTGDSMDWNSSYAAGWRSENCGRVKINQDPAASTKCILAAYAAGKSFQVNVQGFDSSPGRRHPLGRATENFLR